MARPRRTTGAHTRGAHTMAGVFAAVLALAGCGSAGRSAEPAAASSPAASAGASGDAVPAAPATPAAPTSPSATASTAPDGSDSSPAVPKAALTPEALKVAAQRYVDGLLSGQVAKVGPYLDASCTDQDRAGLVVSIGAVKKLAKGVTMTVTATRVVGQRGNVTAFKLSAKAPAELRQVLEEEFRNATSNPWRWVDGHWYNTGPCSGGSAAPTATTAPGPKQSA